MTALPPSWRSYPNADPDQKARQLQARFRAVSRKLDRPRRLQRFAEAARGPALLIFAFGIIGVGVFGFSPFPPMTTLKHLAAAPNCAAARAVGLAPSSKGQPGYYARHERDRDGEACEPWPR